MNFGLIFLQDGICLYQKQRQSKEQCLQQSLCLFRTYCRCNKFQSFQTAQQLQKSIKEAQICNQYLKFIYHLIKNSMFTIIPLFLLVCNTLSSSPSVIYPSGMAHGQLLITSLSNTTFTIALTSAFNATPQGFLAISGIEIVPNMLIDFQCNFQSINTTSFRFLYTSYNSTFTLSKLSINYLIFNVDNYRGMRGASYTAFSYYNIDINNPFPSFSPNSSMLVFQQAITKTNSYNKYQSGCFIYFRGMKIGIATVSNLYQLNMTCFNSQLYLNIRVYGGPNVIINKFKASLFSYDKYELQINQKMIIQSGFVEYKDGITLSSINIPTDYAIFYGLSSFTFLPTLNQFNLANYLTSNASVSPTTGYNVLTYIFFSSFLSCPSGTILNRVTRMCDVPTCSQQFQLFSPQVVSGVFLYEIRIYKSSTIFLVYSNRLDIYQYQSGTGYVFSYRLSFLSSLSSVYSYGFTTNYSRVIVADKNQNIVIYSWNGSAYIFESMIAVQRQNSKSIMNIRISDDALTLFIDYKSTSSIYTFNTYIYNTLTNLYEYSTTYIRNSWNALQLQSFILISKQNKTNIYAVVGNFYQYMKQTDTNQLYQSVSKFQMDPTTNLKSKSFNSYDRTIIATIFINPNNRFGIAIYQRDPITLIHKEIQFIPALYTYFQFAAIDKQGLTLVIALDVNVHFLIYKRANTSTTFDLVDIIEGIQASVIQNVIGLSQDASVVITTYANSIQAFYCPATMPSTTNIPIPNSIYVNSSSASLTNSSAALNSGSMSSSNNSNIMDNPLYIITIIILIGLVVVVVLLIYILLNLKTSNKAVYTDSNNNNPSNLTQNNLQENKYCKSDPIIESIDGSIIDVQAFDNVKPKNIRKRRVKQLEEIHVDSISMIE